MRIPNIFLNTQEFCVQLKATQDKMFQFKFTTIAVHLLYIPTTSAAVLPRSPTQAQLGFFSCSLSLFQQQQQQQTS